MSLNNIPRMTYNQLDAMLTAGVNAAGQPLRNVAKTRALMRMEKLGRTRNVSALSASANAVRRAELAAKAAAAPAQAAGEGGRRRKTSKRSQRKRSTRRRR